MYIYKKVAYPVAVLLGSVFCFAYAGSLTCSITTAAGCTGTPVLRMSGNSNAHAELPSQSNANYDSAVICCTGVTGLGNSCAGTNATVLKLESVTNSHSEIGSLNSYSNKACLSVGAGGYVYTGWQANNCDGYDATLGSVESVANSHVGDTVAYPTKICASASSTPLQQFFTFSLSSNSVSFGELSYVQTRYASSTGEGDASEAEAFNLEVVTNAPSGYFVTVQGQTLTSGSYTVDPAGSANTLPAVGAEQFGMRAVVSGSNGTVTDPYAGPGFAYAASASSASQFAGASVGDSATSTYSVRLMANIAQFTEPGGYLTNLTYVATANF